jgi:hypothetical protein
MRKRKCRRALAWLPGRKRRQYRAYTQEWLAWAGGPRSYGDTFPAFEQWLSQKEDTHV